VSYRKYVINKSTRYIQIDR